MPAHPSGASWRRITAAFALVVLASGCADSDSANDAAAPTPTDTTTSVAAPATVREAVSDGAKIIDVRTPEEFAVGHLRGAINIDVSDPDFVEQIASLDESASYVVYCASGNRAGKAIETMQEHGFEDLVNGGGFEELAAGALPET